MYTQALGEGEYNTLKLFQRHRQELRSRPDFNVLEQPAAGEVGGYGNAKTRRTLHWEYSLRAGGDGCRYHITEHIMLAEAKSAYRHAFIISLGICNDIIGEYAKQREFILSTFHETG